MKILPGLNSSIIVLLALLFGSLATGEARAQVLGAILKKMQAHQQSLSTLRARVRMDRYDAQLKETDTSEGSVVYYRTPGRQIWTRVDWTKPAAESLSFIDGQFIIYRPRLRQAITGKIEKPKNSAEMSRSASFIYLNLKEIKAHYNISYHGEARVKGEIPTWHLRLKPKNAAALYSSAEIWVDGNGMPIQARIAERNQDTTTILLDELEKNQPLKSTVFPLRLPKGTKIITASGGGGESCPCFKPENARDALRYWSDAVFSGKVVAASGADYTFQTERTWKGSIGREIVVRDFNDGRRCAPDKLKAGERYIVFAREAKADNKTVLGLMPCNYTTNIASGDGRKILREIGKGKPIKKKILRKKRRR